VHTVTNGFQGFREINTVDYDPDRISPGEMVSALKAAETYIGIAKER